MGLLEMRVAERDTCRRERYVSQRKVPVAEKGTGYPRETTIDVSALAESLAAPLVACRIVVLLAAGGAIDDFS